MPTLRIDFYESGIGDTIVITFPSGGLGLVDAHPSPHAIRPGIRQIVAGKKLHFVCLTHPHADHGIDLVPVRLSNGTKPTKADTNPLRLQMPGARAVSPASVCNPVISFELDADGKVNVLSGVGCDGCGVAHTPSAK